MFEEIDLYYFQFLMNYKILAKYSDNSGVFKGKIIGIENSGHLIIEKQTGEIKKYDFKEIVFL
jgi:biotin-(acetyl-CoA carboxylase) ligase